MNHWYLTLIVLVFLTGLSRGDEGLRVPSGSTSTVTTGRGGTTVRYPFGKVEIPRDAVWKEKTAVVPLGKLHAKTQGSFRLTYVLAREGNLIVARTVRVRVESKEAYLSPATPKLREHEAMHRRINEAEALRIQGVLNSFQSKETDPAKAEQEFKATFRQEIAAVKKLHAQWDENQVFIKSSTESKTTNVAPAPQTPVVAPFMGRASVKDVAPSGNSPDKSGNYEHQEKLKN